MTTIATNDDTGAITGGGLVPWAPVINVKSAPYNAVGDGVADDTAALQFAIDAAKALTAGGTLFFPRGTYNFSTLDFSHHSGSLNKQLIVRGDGRYATTLKHTGSNIAIYMGGTNWMTFEDLSLNSNVNSKYGFLLCRLSTPNLPACDNNKFINVGGNISSAWTKAFIAGINAEQTTIDRCYIDNEGSSIGTIIFTEIATGVLATVTLPGTDVLGTGTTALANHIVNSSIYVANTTAACVTSESGASIVIDNSILSYIGSVTDAVGVRIVGASGDTSFAPVVITNSLVEMNGGSVVELKSTSGTNTIEGLTIANTHITKSTQVLQYSGTTSLLGFVYDGNAEFTNPTSLTLTNTVQGARIRAISAGTTVVFSSGATITGCDITATAFTDSGATFGGNRLYTLTTHGTTVANIQSAEWQSFLIEITNTAGTIQHRICAGGGALPTGIFVDRITGASSSLANTTTVSSIVDFTSGGGILSGATHVFLFNTAEQVDETSTFGIASLETNDTTTSLQAKYVVRQDNVNGVTRYRPSLQFANPTTNANVTLDTGNIGAGKKIRVHVLAKVK